MDDRNYYRTLELADLIERSEHKPTAELAVVLGERLDRIMNSPLGGYLTTDDTN